MTLKDTELRHRQIKQRQYVVLFKSPIFDAANIKGFTVHIIIVESEASTDRTKELLQDKKNV